jgi:hypothetical protein
MSFFVNVIIPELSTDGFFVESVFGEGLFIEGVSVSKFSRI